MMTRQATILGVYGGYLALVAFILVFGGKQMMLPTFPGALFAIAAWAGVWIFASQKTYWRLANAPAKELDEREAYARLSAYWTAYMLLMAVVFVGLVALSFGSDVMRVKSWDVNDVSAMIWGVFLLGLTLPVAVLMWTYNIDVTEDEA